MLLTDIEMLGAIAFVIGSMISPPSSARVSRRRTTPPLTGGNSVMRAFEPQLSVAKGVEMFEDMEDLPAEFLEFHRLGAELIIQLRTGICASTSLKVRVIRSVSKM